MSQVFAVVFLAVQVSNSAFVNGCGEYGSLVNRGSANSNPPMPKKQNITLTL